MIHSEKWWIKNITFDTVDRAVQNHIPGGQYATCLLREQITPSFTRYQYIPFSHRYIKEFSGIEVRKIGGDRVELSIGIFKFSPRANLRVRRDVHDARADIINPLLKSLHLQPEPKCPIGDE